jgi:hypothetical protein
MHEQEQEQEQEQDHIEFITVVTDGTKRQYNGYYNKENQKYILILNGETQEKIEKHTADIGEGLFDPFAELKYIHQS